MLAGKMQELVAAHDQSITRYSGLKEEYGLQMKLYDAKLAKASLEKTEVSANANEQRLELQKMLVESDEKVTKKSYSYTRIKPRFPGKSIQFSGKLRFSALSGERGHF